MWVWRNLNICLLTLFLQFVQSVILLVRTSHLPHLKAYQLPLVHSVVLVSALLAANYSVCITGYYSVFYFRDWHIFQPHPMLTTCRTNILIADYRRAEEDKLLWSWYYFTVCASSSPRIINSERRYVDKASFLTFSVNSHLQLLWFDSFI